MHTSTQWQGLLKNVGEWQGSFTQLSPHGDLIQDLPSLLKLYVLDSDENLVKFSLQRFPPDADPQELQFEYRYPGPAPQQIPFLPTGAFSQGSMQWSPVGEFGAELALISGDRRLRLVQRYANSDTLTGITLIRESRVGSSAQASPRLTVADLVGTWSGEAITCFADARVSEPFSTQLEVEEAGDHLMQTLTFSNQRLQSVGQILGNRIRFESGAQPLELLMLEGGASSLCPTQIQRGTPFFLEAGWLIEPKLRQRLIRNYSSQGEWVSLTLMTEHKTKG